MREIKIVFDAGKGSVDIAHITAVENDRVGVLPTPTRKGYDFAGWYTAPEGAVTGPKVTAYTIADQSFSDLTTLYAHWTKRGGASAGSTAARRKKQASTSLSKQKKAIWALAAAAIVLIVGVVLTRIIIDIYHYEDLDGTVYTIKKKSGTYGLYDKRGNACDINDDGYYLTALGTQLTIDPKTGECSIYAVVDTEGTEVVGYGQRVLMFKQLTYDMSSTKDLTRVIKTIEVHNAHGTMTLRRGSDTSNRFVVDGFEGTVFSDQLFAQLSVGCGYTISMQRLENPKRLADGSIDYAEYGLAPQTRQQLGPDGQPLLDENGAPVMYEYQPAWYTVTTMRPDAASGLDAYTVTIGDATVSSAGYYARYEDRDTVYILSATNLDAAVLQPVEALITPMIIYPMSLNSYFNVENFILRGDIDYDDMYLHMAATLAGLDYDQIHGQTLSDEVLAQLSEAAETLSQLSEEEFSALYDAALKACSRVITAFSFIDMDARQNTLYTAIPYKMSTEYMAGYLPNSNNLSTLLQKLYSMTFEGVVALGPSDELLETYGLVEPAFLISFLYHDTDGQNHANRVSISAKTEDGKYYAYSDIFDMIVVFDESQAPYLEWGDMDWYEREYYQYNIAFVSRVKLEGAAIRALGGRYLASDGSITFDLDNSASDQSQNISSEKLQVYLNGATTPVDYTLMVTKPSGSKVQESGVYNFRRFMQSMLTASIEGLPDLTEAQMQAMRDTPDEDCQLKITILLDDHHGNTLNLVYRFYQYTERRSFMTIEVLPTPDAPSSPQNGQGKFYVLRSFCDKMVADAARFVDQQEIDPDSKT